VPGLKLIALAVVFFVTSVVSVVTGSTSLITVPILTAFGLEPHAAVATNMMALILMSAGGALPFLRKGVIDRGFLPLSIALTVLGSGVGAFLLLNIRTKPLQLAIAIAMIAVAIFSLFRQDGGKSHQSASSVSQAGGYLLTFALAVYGGFFSGGYVTMLTVVFVLLFGMTFLQAVATTTIINIFSSLVATLIFAQRGIVTQRTGYIVGCTPWGEPFVETKCNWHTCRLMNFATRTVCSPPEWPRLVKRKRALVETNPPRNKPAETHRDDDGQGNRFRPVPKRNRAEDAQVLPATLLSLTDCNLICP
jgi:uncharacterized protein